MASRIMTINLRKYLSTQPRTKRIKRGMRYLRERIAHYTKTDEANVKISDELNRMMFKHYIKSMTPVKVNVDITDGIAKVGLFKDASKQAVQPAAKPVKGKPATAPAANTEKDAKKPAAAPDGKKNGKQPETRKPQAPAQPKK